ncbi:class I SAM-dependent methyltransferase [Paenibacillus sp. UNC451MF]|uniref:class I SAM-dependent methyltransferase n=1 Tax=Paenibacillus sp. UNC451MF TaxID=1449063 RepID=UPI002F35042F
MRVDLAVTLSFMMNANRFIQLKGGFNMPDHDAIYQQEADKYHLMISKQKPLLSTIEELVGLEGLDILDLGAGSGRFTVELASKAKSIVALDHSEAMLKIAANRLQEEGYTHWRTVVADHRSLPLEDHSVDFIIAGWTVCYLTNADVPDALDNLRLIIAEMKRVLRPNGMILIFETMGTGEEQPNPPEFLKTYYAALVQDYGFHHKWIRTDYTFDNIQQAEQITRFFFGESTAKRVVERNWTHLPECAGMWWLTL